MDEQAARPSAFRTWPIFLGFAGLAILGPLGGCGSGQPASTAPVGSTVPLTTAGGPACPVGVGEAAQDAPQAARCLDASWMKGDRASAAAFASLDVVDLLFQRPWAAPASTFQGCTAQADGGQACGFGQPGARYVFVVRPSEGGWRVTQLQPAPHG